MAHSRAQVRLDTNAEVTEFVKMINSDGSLDRFIIEDFSGIHRVSARSFLGVLYASAEFPQLFLVNETNDGQYPIEVNKFRPLN